jgi:hypothetical protein
MPICGSCSGRGTNTCFSCGGRKFHQRLTVSGDMDISPCVTCGGRGSVRCQFCMGTGNVGAAGPVGTPSPHQPGANEDILAGRWNAAQGGWYEFAKLGGDYTLTEYGPFGPTGTGVATVSGNTVTLDVTNAMLGRYTVRLRLSGNNMQGTVNIMGVPMPFVLTRD